MYFIKIFWLGIVSIFKFAINFFRYFLIGLINIFTIFPKYLILGIKSIFKKKIKKKISNGKHNKKINTTMICLSLSVYLICIFLLSKWSVQELKIKYLANDIISSTEQIEKENTNLDKKNDSTNDNSLYYPDDYWDYLTVPLLDVNFDNLLNKNSDTVGWIKIDGTKVNYPIVQSNDNQYYLTHSYNKSSNIAGWIFADYRDNFKDFDRNTIIYGHNMNNKTMFGSVPSMLYNGYLNNSSNYFIKISTPTCDTLWKTFSVYTIEPETYYLKTNFDSESYDEFLNKIKQRSVYNFRINVSSNDKILTLSTCDNTGTKRVAVHAKMVSIKYK